MVTSAAEVGDWRGLCELRRDVERTLSRSCRDKSELDDMVQDTLLRAARFRGSLHDPSRLRSWVLRIAWNVMRDHVRRERRLKRVEAGEGLLVELEGCEHVPGRSLPPELITMGDQLFEGEELLRILGELLPELSADERALFEVYYGKGLGCHRAAAQLQITTQTIKMRLFRLRRKLRRELHKRSMLASGPRIREAVA